MSKHERREALLNSGEFFGSIAVALEEIRKLETEPDESDLATISVGCGAALTLICC